MTDSFGPGRGRFWLVQAVTLLRIPLALAFAGLLWLCPLSWPVLFAGGLLLLFLEASDSLDGLLARRLGAVSEWGALLDPYADSLSRFTVYWALAFSGLTLPVLPWAMAFRGITVAYCRILLARQGKSGSARLSGKVKAVVQGGGAVFLVCGPLWFGPSRQGFQPVVSWTVLVVTLASSIEYIRNTAKAFRRR